MHAKKQESLTLHMNFLAQFCCTTTSVKAQRVNYRLEERRGACHAACLGGCSVARPSRSKVYGRGALCSMANRRAIKDGNGPAPHRIHPGHGACSVAWPVILSAACIHTTTHAYRIFRIGCTTVSWWFCSRSQHHRNIPILVHSSQCNGMYAPVQERSLSLFLHPVWKRNSLYHHG